MPPFPRSSSSKGPVDVKSFKSMGDGALPKPFSRKRPGNNKTGTPSNGKKPKVAKVVGISDIPNEFIARERDEISSRAKPLIIGSTVVCVVTQITSTQLFVDLPRNEAGVIQLAEIAEEGFAHLSQKLIREFKLHDILIAVVTAVNTPTKQNRKSHLRYKLSLRPSRIFPSDAAAFLPVKNQLLPVSIVSVEEHGLMAVWTDEINGSSNPTVLSRAFIKTDAAPSYSTGQIVYVVVDAIKRDQHLVICRLEKELPGRYLSQKSSLEMSGLCAGQLVECTIQGVLTDFEQNKGGEVDERPLPLSDKKKKDWLLPSTVSEGGASKRPLEGLLTPDGTHLTVLFGGALNATVPNAHLHNLIVSTVETAAAGPLAAAFPFYPSQGEEKKDTTAPLLPSCPHFQGGQQFIGRIICVNKGVNSTKDTIIYVSALPHLVHFKIPSQFSANLDQVAVGSVVNDARVIKSNLKHGVTLLYEPTNNNEANTTINNELTSPAVGQILSEWKMQPKNICLCHCEKSLVADQLVEKEILGFKFGQKKTCRILEKNYCEGSVTVALSSSYVGSDDMKLIEQVKVGQLVSGTVKKCFDWGIFVSISDQLDGKVEAHQLQDTPAAAALSTVPKCKEGQTGRFRVLHVDSEFKSVTLTAKKSFLRMSSDEISKHLDSCKIELNDSLNMYVLGLRLKGLALRGLGDLQGILRYEEIGLSGYESDEKFKENLSALNKALVRKRFSPGCSCRVRVDRITKSFSGVDMPAKYTISFSLDLDKVAPTENYIDQTQSAAASVATLSLQSRLQDASPITRMDINNKSYQELVDRALQLLPIGSEVDGVVQNIHDGSQTMQLAVMGSVRCTLHVLETTTTDDDDVLEDFPLSKYHIGQTLRVRIVGAPPIELPKRNLVFLEGSLRRLGMSEELELLPRAVSDLTVGQVLTGVAFGVDFTGVLVAISSAVKVRIKFCYLSGSVWESAEGENDIEKAKRAFPSGKVIPKVMIRSVSYKQKRAEGTMKLDEFAILMKLQGLDKVNFESVQEQKNYVARVHAVKDFGVFVSFENSDDDLSGLCHLSEILDQGIPGHLPSMYNPDDMVLVKVIKKDEDKHRIAVSMKPSHFGDIDFSELIATDKDTALSNNELTTINVSASNSPFDDYNSPASTAPSLTTQSESQVEEALNENIFNIGRDWLQEDWQPVPLASSITTTTQEGKNDDKKDQTNKAKKKLMTKKETLPEREKRLRDTERKNASGEWAENPQTIDDFERLILVNGHDSNVWIRYMSYYADRQDFVRAAEIAERGINYMDISKDEERRNIWLAWINLEDYFGTKESRREIWERALQCNEVKPIFTHILNLLETKGEVDEAVTVCKRMTNKLSQDISCWLRYLKVLYSKPMVVSENKGSVNPKGAVLSQGDRQEIDGVVKMALRALLESERILFRSGVAKLEYGYGSSEIGRSLFLEILKEKPKRTDVWNVFLDCQEREVRNAGSGRMKNEQIEVTRKLYVSATSIQLKVEKMKRLLKRWMNFEESSGTEAGKEMCKERAHSYVAEKKE